MGKLATTKPWAAKVPTVLEYWESVREATESLEDMQIEDVQAAADRGWAEVSGSDDYQGGPGELGWFAKHLYRDYCRNVRRRPAVTATREGRGLWVFVGALRGEGWTVPLAGCRRLLSLAASAMEVSRTNGGLFHWRGDCFEVVIPPGDIEVFAASVRDIVEEHVEEVAPRRRRARSTPEGDLR